MTSFADFIYDEPFRIERSIKVYRDKLINSVEISLITLVLKILFLQKCVNKNETMSRMKFMND